MNAENAWSELMPLAEGGRVHEMLACLQAVPEGEERINCCRVVIRGLAFEDWDNKNLDVMTAIADYAIAEGERLGGEFFQSANVICFNTSANLCDCWGDDFPRLPHHFEKGLDYAEHSLRLRRELGKGPLAEAKATWAIGKHQQSLGWLREATDSFRRCLELEKKAARANGKPEEVGAGAPDGLLIATAYLALMEGDRRVLDSVKTVLEEMEDKTDAGIIGSQLRETAKTIDPTLWPG
jgi:hypothetical protein